MPKKREGLAIETEASSEELDYDLMSPAQERKKLFEARSPGHRELEMPEDLRFLIDSLGFEDWWNNPVINGSLSSRLLSCCLAGCFS